MQYCLRLWGAIGSLFTRFCGSRHDPKSIWTRNLDIPKKEVSREGLLSQLRVDLNQVIKLVEDISLNPAKEVIKQIEQERLLAKLKKELKKIIEEIESLKQAE